MNRDEKLELAYQKIKQAKNILLIGHTGPDADAISSLGVLIELIKSLSISYYAYTERKPYGAYTYVPNEELISGVSPDDLKDYDLIIILDCGAINRTGLEDRLRRLIKARNEGALLFPPYIIEFDHHNQSESYADLEIRYPDCASTIPYSNVTGTPSGLSVTINTAKLTTLGTNGSMTFTNGILTSQTQAT